MDDAFEKGFKIIIQKILKFSIEKPKQFGITLFLLLYIISVILYYNSILGCPYNQIMCLSYIGKKFLFERAWLCLYCSYIIGWIFNFFMLKYIHFSFIIFLTIFYLINFFLFTGSDLYKHGIYNTIVMCIVIPFSFLFNLVLISICNSFKKYNIKKGFIILFCLILPIAYFNIKPYFDCYDWGNGLLNTRLATKEESRKDNNLCYFETPKFCYKKMFDNIFDISKYIFLKCEKQDKNARNILLKYKDKSFAKTMNFAYPILLHLQKEENVIYNFQKKSIDLMYDLDNMSEEQKKLPPPEVTLHFDKKGNGRVNISVKRNETLVNERKKLFEEKKNNIKFDNILFLYFDALSRNHFLKKLKKTKKLLENYYYKNPKKLKGKSSFQFFKYNNLGTYTNINIVPMFYGTTNGKSLIDLFKNNGFITAQTNDLCSRELYTLEYSNYNVLKTNYSDHEHFGLFCDPNYMEVKSPYSIFKGPYSIKRRCLYGKDVGEYIFEYGKSFLEAYKDVPKFLRLAINDGHESTIEVIKYMDEPVYKFLEYYLENHFTEKSLIIITSDHGQNMPDLNDLLKSDDNIKEKTLGTLFLILPDQNENNINLFNSTAININEQRFLTPYDIHDTFIDILGLNETEKSKYGQSLFKEIDGSKRFCKYYPEFSNRIRNEFYSCQCIDFNDNK